MISFRRFYHVSLTLCSIKKQGAKLCKMVNPKSKKQYYPSPNMETSVMPSLKSLTKVQKVPGKQGIRRVAMLNKLFMKQITDLMSTGTVSMDIVGRGIEISKVQVTSDFQAVNVFWVCKGDATDEETESVLKKTAGALRHELSTLRVMGEVPYIVFVKGKQEALIADLDRRLAVADYGEDFQTTELGHLLKTEFTLDTKLSPEMKAKIKQLEDDMPLVKEPIPEMTHNVYGLDHAKIMSRLLAARKRGRDAWNKLDADNTVISYRMPEYKTEETNTEQQRQQLAEFLHKRQILQNKLHKQLLKPREEWQLAPDDDDVNDENAYEEFEDDDYYDENDEIYGYEDTNVHRFACSVISGGVSGGVREGNRPAARWPPVRRAVARVCPLTPRAPAVASPPRSSRSPARLSCGAPSSARCARFSLPTTHSFRDASSRRSASVIFTRAHSHRVR
ncbi:uncharacterized protein ACR2FA_002694 [Aphomia sociella]